MAKGANGFSPRSFVPSRLLIDIFRMPSPQPLPGERGPGFTPRVERSDTHDRVGGGVAPAVPPTPPDVRFSVSGDYRQVSTPHTDYSGLSGLALQTNGSASPVTPLASATAATSPNPDRHPRPYAATRPGCRRPENGRPMILPHPFGLC
jgi:hypothetical protein